MVDNRTATVVADYPYPGGPRPHGVFAEPIGGPSLANPHPVHERPELEVHLELAEPLGREVHPQPVDERDPLSPVHQFVLDGRPQIVGRPGSAVWRRSASSRRRSIPRSQNRVLLLPSAPHESTGMMKPDSDG